jgi:hypothetical protein
MEIGFSSREFRQVWREMLPRIRFFECPGSFNAGTWAVICVPKASPTSEHICHCHRATRCPRITG